MNRKLEAYTILEITLGMLLTTIIIGIGYKALGLLQKRTLQNSNSSQEVKIAAIHYLLLKDFQNSEFASIESPMVILNNQKNNDNIVYYMNPQSLIRSSSLSNDTISLSNISWKASLQNQTVEFGIIDAISIQIEECNFIFNLSANKEYSPYDLIRLKLIE